MAQQARGLRRRERKNITNGVAHVNSTFNNTIINIADNKGNVISWSSSRQKGFKGSRKAKPDAAQVGAEGAPGEEGAPDGGPQEGAPAQEDPNQPPPEADLNGDGQTSQDEAEQ